jgi:Xaa-Pro aminopeptidase
LFDKNFKVKIKDILNKTLSSAPLSGGEFAVAMENSAKLSQKEYWQDVFSEIEIVTTDKVIQNWRAVKNTNELQKVREACLQLDKVFADKDFFRGILTAGVTEKEVAFQLEMKLRDFGKYKLSFPVIVAFGENSAVPHHKPGNRQLKFRENILIDCGVKFENYCSDMTRNFFLGSPSSDYLEKFEILLNAQEKTLQKFQIGQKLLAAQEFCKQELGNFAGFFTHSLGHGVGLDIHELPSFSEKEQAIFTTGQVVTCEPGIYFPAKFGIRIEDQVLITKDGPEILTKTPKELMIL